MSTTACHGCGAHYPERDGPESDGPTHRYLGASSGCWACYGEVLAREFSDLEYYQVHRLTVDAYSIQHPGEPSLQTIRSVALHSISLCAILENGADLRTASKILGEATKDKSRFEWLTPPASMGPLTIVDVHRARSAEEHVEIVQRFAESAWAAWSEHHPTFRKWLAEIWQPPAH